MKTTKLIPNTKVLLQLLVIPALFALFQACDTLESDPDIIDNETEITGKEVYLRPNNPTFIDLNAKIQSNQAVKFSVTSQTKNGELTDLGSGMLRYSSLKGSASTRDAFEFTVYSLNNEVLKKDSIILIVDSDSTNLPCGVYPASDNIYGYNPMSGPLLIDVTANDIICTSDTIISIYHPGNSTFPYHGAVEVVGNKIKYTPEATFGEDSIMYRITSASDPSVLAYGLVYINTDPASGCFKVGNDSFIFVDSVTFISLPLEIFDNDSLCYTRDQYQFTVSQAPKNGSVEFDPYGALYTPGSPIVSGYTDFFYYKICRDGVCKTARVDIFIVDTPVCTPIAVRDSLELTLNDSLTYYLDVTSNDLTCDGLTSLSIMSPPTHGQAIFDSNNKIRYRRNEGDDEVDMLTYKICNGTGCSEATVLIHIVD